MPSSDKSQAADKRSVLKAQQEIINGLSSTGKGKAAASALQALDSKYADDCVIIGSFGEVISKEQYMQALRSNSLAYQGMKTSDVNVRVYGDVAIITSLVTGQSQLQGQNVGGGEFRCTSVLVRNASAAASKGGDEWQMVSGHVSFVDRRIAGLTGGGRGK